MLSILMIFAAYTVPQMWSDIMRRERDYQTVFAMKQYARAITEYTKQRKVPPTTLDDLEKQMKPRVLRKLYPNPLSGEVDWILVTADPAAPGNTAPGLPQNPTPTPPPPPGVDSRKPGGAPFIGVRPPQTGKSFLALNEKTTYETWSYTVNDLQRELTPVPPGGAVPPPKKP